MRIHIIGESGAGKTYTARIINQKYNIPIYDLDDAQFDNTVRKRRSNTARNKILNSWIKKDSWIIEGCYHLWVDNSFEKADYIFYLSPNLLKRSTRIIKRFIKRKLNIEPSKGETIKSIYKLIMSYVKVGKIQRRETLEKLTKYKNKTYIVKSTGEILKILNSLHY